MKIFIMICGAICLSITSLSVLSDESKQGKLVIAGGAISQYSTEIFDQFAQFSGGKNAKIGVIPAATGTVEKQFKLLQTHFSAAGVAIENIKLLPLATKDDGKTEVDESQWQDNGNSESVAKQIETLTGVWFIGGDQTLITRVLLNDDGSDTLVLEQIRELYKRGGVLGGTSAGAAIMSNIMIAGGNSQGALFHGFKQDYSSMDEQEYGPAAVSKGLGFFQYGVIDQHFDRKGRLGRLIATLLNENKHNVGFGVDEGTAMLVADNSFSVIGEGGVTVVDVSKVTGYTPDSFPIQANNIRLSHLQPGDSFDLTDLTFTKRSEATSTVNHEYFQVPQQSISGLVNANRNLDQFIGYDLLDNKTTNQVSSWLINGEQALQLVFSQDPTTQGYWNIDVTADVYSFENVKLDIKQVSLKDYK